MFLYENPVLQRELLCNLRMARGFVLLLVYQLVLALVVYCAWPQDARIDLTQRADAATVENRALNQARRLADIFFLGQYLLACMMAPTFAAGAITGEKERKTYEMLLASPLRPSAIVLGKLIASLTHLMVLIIASLPTIVLCLPLGGISLYEVIAAYVGLLSSVVFFGMVSVACSTYYQRTASALVVSYLLILPVAMGAVTVWYLLSTMSSLRLFLSGVVLPWASLAGTAALLLQTSRRLLRPPDVGSEGKDVVDIEQESQTAVGLVIQPDQFPDRLFAPPKRTTLMDDHANPVYDKEIRSEIFSQGTLMLRLVIQISILLALPLMAICLFMNERWAPWYVAYVLLFNMMVGPVFSSGSLTSERERQTLELLLTTILSPWQIVIGKLLAGLRVSSVLTFLLLWPLALAAVLLPTYWSIHAWMAVLGYVIVVAITCLTTAQLALCCSALMKKTAHAMILAYAVLLILFCVPVGVVFYIRGFYPDASWRSYAEQVAALLSPLSTAIQLPVSVPEDAPADPPSWVVWLRYASHIGWAVVLNLILFGILVVSLRRRWRLA